MGKTKKQESSSESSSSSEEQPKVKAAPAPKAAAPAKGKPAPKKEESSSESSSEEAPKKEAPKKEAPKKEAPKKEAPKKEAPKKAAPKKASSSSESSGSSESSSEEVKPAPKKAAPAPAKAAAKKASSSSSSSSEEEDEAPAPKPAANEKKRKAEAEAATPPAKKARTDSPAPSTPAGEGEVTRVFVGNLPFTIDDEQIRAVFADVGEVKDIHWVTDRQTGKFYGNGFLEFATPAEAKAAVAKAGTDVGGRPMKVDLAQPRADKKGGAGATPRGDKFERPKREATPKPEGCTTVFLGNLSFQIDEDTVRSTFADCGEISAIRWVERDGQFKGCGFVEFASSDATDKAVAKNGQDVLGRPMRVDYSAPKPPRQ